MSRWGELETHLAGQICGERLQHTHRVVETARELVRRFGGSLEQAETAGLMHDYAKAMPPADLLMQARSRTLVVDPAEEQQPHLLHGPVAAALLLEKGLVTDPEVLDAIRWHTTGRAFMTHLEKIIWLADYIEPGRAFSGVEAIRSLAHSELDRALLMALDQTITYVIQRGWPLHVYTVHARNWLLSSLTSC